MAPQNQQRNLLAMLLSGGGRGDPYQNEKSMFATRDPAANVPVPYDRPVQNPPAPLPRPDTSDGGGGDPRIPIPLPRPDNPDDPLYRGPFIPSPVSQRNRYAGSPDPMSGRYMPWIRW